jgi:WD40 repeat protein
LLGPEGISYHPLLVCINQSGSDSTIKLWDVRTNQLLQHYRAHAGPVTHLTFHPSGNFLISSSLVRCPLPSYPSKPPLANSKRSTLPHTCLVGLHSKNLGPKRRAAVLHLAWPRRCNVGHKLFSCRRLLRIKWCR